MQRLVLQIEREEKATDEKAKEKNKDRNKEVKINNISFAIQNFFLAK